MKIAYLSPAWPAAQAQNGIATYVDMMTRALEKAGHECVVLTPRLIGEKPAANVFQIGTEDRSFLQTASHSIERRLRGDLYVWAKQRARSIAQALERASLTSPIDIFEMEESYGVASHVQHKLLPIPTVVRLHGPHFLVHQGNMEAENRQRIAAEGLAIKQSRAVSCPSGSVLNKVSDYYGFHDFRGQAIPNPVDTEIEGSQWSLEGCDRNVLVFVGRFDAIKGADIMLKTFRRLAVRYSDLQLVMVGKDIGIAQPDGTKLTFNDYAAAHLDDDLRARISFRGPVSRNDANDLRKRAFMCISASRFECFPYAVTEAFALGCPVVATATDGLTEYFEAGSDLLLAPIGDVEALENKIVQMLENPEKAAEIGAAGRRSALKMLAPDHVAAKSLDFYKHAIHGDYEQSNAAQAGARLDGTD